jgi:hypothetical protein
VGNRRGIRVKQLSAEEIAEGAAAWDALQVANAAAAAAAKTEPDPAIEVVGQDELAGESGVPADRTKDTRPARARVPKDSGEAFALARQILGNTCDPGFLLRELACLMNRDAGSELSLWAAKAVIRFVGAPAANYVSICSELAKLHYQDRATVDRVRAELRRLSLELHRRRSLTSAPPKVLWVLRGEIKTHNHEALARALRVISIITDALRNATEAGVWRTPGDVT